MKSSVTITVIGFLFIFSFSSSRTKSNPETDKLQSPVFKENMMIKTGYSNVNGLKMYWELH